MFNKIVLDYGQVPGQVQSDSEGEDSLVSTEDSGSSSSAGCEHDDDDDLGVVRDLELDSDSNQHLCHLKSSDTGTITYLTTTLPHQKSLMEVFYPQPIAINKKGVRFADDCGGSLETIRVITEPSDYPPLISPAVIRRYRKAAANSDINATASSSSTNGDDEDDDESTEKTPRSTWKMAFKQPASEYVKFRDTLETKKVALENVMLKNEIGRMLGTIKVIIFYLKNCFLKEEYVFFKE